MRSLFLVLIAFVLVGCAAINGQQSVNQTGDEKPIVIMIGVDGLGGMRLTGFQPQRLMKWRT